MSGHDYQRVYAQMLAQFTADSQRRPSIKANNQALRARAKQAQKADIAAQFAQHAPKPRPLPPTLTLADGDDEFRPAPRRTV
ncbi:hypothetical protein D3C81_2044010 [compost metagenome]